MGTSKYSTSQKRINQDGKKFYLHRVVPKCPPIVTSVSYV